MNALVFLLIGILGTPILLAIIALVRSARNGEEIDDLRRDLAELRHDVLRLERERQRVTPPAEPKTTAREASIVEKPTPSPRPHDTQASAPPPPPVRPPASRAPASPPPASAPPPPPSSPPPPSKPWLPSIDWESLVGVKLFSWISGIAFVLAALFFLRYSIEHGWLRPEIRAAIGFLSGSLMLAICELRVARNYRVTANALHGAGIAILYATLFATHALWHLLPAGLVFVGMVLVTIVAVTLSIRRDALFIALLGMMGGFATPALLSTGENRPIALFSYLLLLNGGLAWVALRKRWTALTIGSLVFTVFYQWSWIAKFLGEGQLSLAAAIFLVFAFAGGSAMWLGRRDDAAQRTFDRVALLAVMLPLLFAFYAAAVPAYGAQLHTLFAFLFLISAGLLFIATKRGPAWLSVVATASILLTFAIWTAVSYSRHAWPFILAWIAAFVVMQSIAHVVAQRKLIHGAALLFFIFPVLVAIEPAAASPLFLFGTMLILLVLVAAVAVRFEEGMAWLIASLFAIATMAMWSARYLTADRLYAGLAIDAVFGLLFLAVPLVARKMGRALRPEDGVSATAILSLAMLFFLTFDRIAATALWGLATLLAVLLLGVIAEARASKRPWLAAAAVVLSWLVLASWWEAGSLQPSLIPALFVIASLGVLILLASIGAARDGEQSGLFAMQTHLALIGHLFLLFVAAHEDLAFPPWPFFAVLGVLDLAIAIAALHLRRGTLMIGCAALSELVLIVWASHGDSTAWANVALAAACAIAAFVAFTAFVATRRANTEVKEFLLAAAVALLAGHIVAWVVASTVDVPLFATLLLTHLALAIATLCLAWKTEWHGLALAGVAATAIGTALAHTHTPAQELLFAAVLWAPYIAYPLLLGARVKRAIEPHLAAVLASAPFFFFARDAVNRAGLGDVIGVLPVAQAMVMLLLLLRLLHMEPRGERMLSRLALVAGAALAFITAAVPLQLEKQWITIAWALEGAALVWLFNRVPHRGVLLWGRALLAIAFARLVFNPAVFGYHPKSLFPIVNWYLYTYLLCAAACFAAAWFSDRKEGRAIAAANAAGSVLLFFLLNIEIADFYSTGATLTFNFLSSSLGQDLTYTIAWALFAVAMLIAGIVLHARAPRVAAILLLLLTVLKCFLHDLSRLGGLYRVGSLFGLALALVFVGVLLQRFVLTKTLAADEVSA